MGLPRHLTHLKAMNPSPGPKADGNELVGGVGVTHSYLRAKSDRTHARE